MMDDLDLQFEDRDRSRQRRRGSGAERGREHPPRGGGYASSGGAGGYGTAGSYGGDGYGQQPGYGYPPPQQPGYGYPPPQQPGYGQHDPYGGQPGVYGGGYQEPYEAGYEDEYETRTSRNAKNKKKTKAKKKRGRKKFVWVLAAVLLLCLGGGGYIGQKLYASMATPDFEGDGQGEVSVEIKQGASGAWMAKALVEAGVIKSTKAFILVWDKNADEANKIQPGVYALRKQMSAQAAMTLLLDPKSRKVSGITVPEGLSSFRIYKLLAEKLKLPEADFKEAAKDPVALGVPEAWFARKDGKPVVKSIEGFLFPDTYQFPPNVTAKDALTRMVKRFLEVAKQVNFEQKFAANSKASPYQGLIVASLAQAEAGNADDLGKVARVAYNRVYKRIPQMSCACLQMDVTVNYSLELKGLPPKPSKDFTQKELTDPKNPYNRNADGLVPTPINNPGKKALEGAATPPEGNWYYFVAIDKLGHSAFSETYADFCKNNAIAVQNGVLTKSSC